MKSPIMRILGMASWLITALASINIGTAVMGYDFFRTNFMMTTMASAVMPIYYIIGVAGVASLIMFFMASYSSDCSCGCK